MDRDRRGFHHLGTGRISSPDRGAHGRFVVIVYGIVQKYGLDGLTVATLMAGAILVIMV